MTTTRTATLTARYDITPDRPSWFDITVNCGLNTESTATELQATLPKSYRARIQHVSVEGGVEHRVIIGASLLPTEGNQANETGVKRVRAAEKKLRSLGFDVAFAPIAQISNSYLTREDFEAAIA